MSRSERAAVLALVLAAAPAQAGNYGLGRDATPQEVAEWDIDVRPDGQGLPKGRGSVSEGEGLYEAKCSTCHGTFGESAEFMALSGGERSVGSKLNYATTLWDYINRAMPFTTPKALTADETYALTAYVLNLNNVLPADAVLDQDSLPKVKMPNRDAFTRNHGMGSVRGKPDVNNTACMKDCEKEVKITSELPPNFTQQLYGDISVQFRGLATMNQGGAHAVKTAAAVPAPAPAKLAQQHACSACHGIANRIVGPGFREVAAKYQGQADAPAKLFAKLKSGGSGVWGSVPMPSQAHVPEADRKALIDWILSAAPE